MSKSNNTFDGESETEICSISCSALNRDISEDRVYVLQCETLECVVYTHHNIHTESAASVTTARLSWEEQKVTGEGTFSRKAKVDSPPTVEVRSEADCCEERGAADAAGTSCIDGVATPE